MVSICALYDAYDVGQTKRPGLRDGRVPAHFSLFVLAYLLERVIDAALEKTNLSITAPTAIEEPGRIRACETAIGRGRWIATTLIELTVSEPPQTPIAQKMVSSAPVEIRNPPHVPRTEPRVARVSRRSSSPLHKRTPKTTIAAQKTRSATASVSLAHVVQPGQ